MEMIEIELTLTDYLIHAGDFEAVHHLDHIPYVFYPFAQSVKKPLINDMIYNTAIQQEWKKLKANPKLENL